MLYFDSDYNNGVHEEILKQLLLTNNECLPGYGSDKYSLSAKEKILKECGLEDGDVFFLTGGTQTNRIIIDSLLKSYEGVLTADTGHISVHEAGAIEASGHKVLTLPSYEGLIKSKDLKEYLEKFYNDENHDHMVFPGMVYISYPSEYGTLYTLEELKEIYSITNTYDIPLFIDGARLGYGLVASDITLKDISSICDVFYIGGTKVGALCGEAIVFTKKAPDHFMTFVKQNGALLAKGRLLGIQFDTLFTNDLYLSISKHAIEMALLLKKGLLEKGYHLYIDSPTNQQFLILENNQYQVLQSQVAMSFWEALDDTHTVIRLATSWATKKKDVQALLDIL